LHKRKVEADWLTARKEKHTMIGQDGVPWKKSRISIGRTPKKAMVGSKKRRTQHWKQ